MTRQGDRRRVSPPDDVTTSGDGPRSPDDAPTAADSAEATRLQVHRRTLRVLIAGQVIGGVGVGTAISVGSIIAEQLGGSPSWAGAAATTLTLGAAVFSVPLAGLALRRGRRFSLTAGLMSALLGAVLVLVATTVGSFVLFLLGMVVFGSGSATNLQMRFAATDLAPPSTRARDLSFVVWATTIGSVAGPNLTSPGAAVARGVGLPPLAGPILFSAVAFALGAAVVYAALRPDPLRLAQRHAAAEPAAAVATTRTPAGALRGLPAVLGVVMRTPRARFALVTIVVSHAVMVAVMAMAPVHLAGTTHAHLTVVGLAISLHIAGMYALSPLVGWLADRWGRVPVALAGQGILLTSVAVSVAGQAAHGSVTAGLVLLGLGWSCGLVSSSTLLAESLDADTRVRAAGVSDLLMNVAGALGGALAGPVLGLLGYGGVNVLAGLLTVPVLVLGARLLAAGGRG